MSIFSFKLINSTSLSVSSETIERRSLVFLAIREILSTTKQNIPVNGIKLLNHLRDPFAVFFIDENQIGKGRFVGNVFDGARIVRFSIIKNGIFRFVQKPFFFFR